MTRLAMTTPTPTMTVPQMMYRMQTLLGISQRKLGDLMGVSSRSIIRYYKGGATLLPSTYEALARAVHPKDPSFAAYLATFTGKTLVQMGLERPPAPPPPPLPPPRPMPTREHLVDSILCVAADALQTTPRAMRPGVTAALQRMIAVGLTAEEVLGEMGPGKEKEREKERGNRKGEKGEKQ